FLAAAPPGDPRRRALLEHLVAADQEHRWKRSGPRLHRSSGGAADATLRGQVERPPRLEEYVARFPELDTPGAPLAANLIAPEHRRPGGRGRAPGPAVPGAGVRRRRQPRRPAPGSDAPAGRGRTGDGPGRRGRLRPLPRRGPPGLEAGERTASEIGRGFTRI